MPTANPISEDLVRDHLLRAVADVFKTMLGRSVQSLPPGPHQPGPQVVGTVGFLGEANGLMYLYFEEAFANQCTSRMLGLSAEELADIGDEAVNDAIGELTNMAVGSFKNGLCDAGYPCKLTIPSILRGSEFSVEPIGSARRHVYAFACDGHRIVADILLKSED